MLAKIQVDPKQLTELMYLAKTIWAEARSEGVIGMRLVAWVIRNRVNDKRWPDTYYSVTTQRAQFSAWLPNDPNRPKLADPLAGGPKDDEAWFAAISVADRVMDAPESENPLPGVYHYFDVRLKDNPPSWAKGKELITMFGAPRLIFVKG